MFFSLEDFFCCNFASMYYSCIFWTNVCESYSCIETFPFFLHLKTVCIQEWFIWRRYQVKVNLKFGPIFKKMTEITVVPQLQLRRAQWFGSFFKEWNQITFWDFSTFPISWFITKIGSFTISTSCQIGYYSERYIYSVVFQRDTKSEKLSCF